ncbi:hypothetical protein BN1232_05445 [Mycobacterium lentiflavum]|uniref:Membrane-anchored protein n=1 Tax=Mycobacterium lentiflavum TaxID=141349 RepID=A0A0E3WDW8_MYCLN|nr:hypothetical protein [Mycobacterium lentiflavum]CQD21981.1 hypothetical protein BN1232_05445 [Mycobacterium lentiflavum]
MSQMLPSIALRTPRRMLSKVPEVTVWFWVIKILCTTVGESFADWISTTVGLGLSVTALIFTVALGIVLAFQLILDRYLPIVYWLAVVVLSITGTLYTDLLTDKLHVPLAVSTAVFATILAVVFGVWYARERTLSIHSIVTTPRELCYWLAVLVTFALGTAVGDWTLQLTGWGPGTSVLLPAALIASIAIGWRVGANPVLSFWLAYILTRPLGANLGDWLASPSASHGLGWGTAITSAIFLAAILVTVGYLMVSRSDVIDDENPTRATTVTTNPTRERLMLGYYTAAAVATGALLLWSAHGHADGPESDEELDSATAATITAPAQPGQPAAAFPPAEVAKFRSITQDTLSKLRAGDQAGAKARIKDLETAWDDDEPKLKPMNQSAWHTLDKQIDGALAALRAPMPNPATEKQQVTALLTALQ